MSDWNDAIAAADELQAALSGVGVLVEPAGNEGYARVRGALPVIDAAAKLLASIRALERPEPEMLSDALGAVELPVERTAEQERRDVVAWLQRAGPAGMQRLARLIESGQHEGAGDE